jgi:SOS-response transcriptional repressor LexA
MPTPLPYDWTPPESRGGQQQISVLAMDRIDPVTRAWFPTVLEYIHIPPHMFRPHLLVVRMEDGGMEPRIRRHAYVGLDRGETSLLNGETYALDIDGEGLVIRRLIQDNQRQRLQLLADAPGHETRFVPFGTAGITVVGKVIWVIQHI